MKQVEYMSQFFDVPDWAEFICADMGGGVWVFSEKPVWQDGGPVVQAKGMKWKVGYLRLPAIMKI